jgi:hypothetical protein
MKSDKYNLGLQNGVLTSIENGLYFVAIRYCELGMTFTLCRSPLYIQIFRINWYNSSIYKAVQRKLDIITLVYGLDW